MAGSTLCAFLLAALPLGAHSVADVRLVDEAGGVSSVGLLQVATEAGFGTVCGANAAAADVICRSMGYAQGSISSSPCRFYGGADLCGAAGSPVAMADLKCSGLEWGVEECSWSVPDEACLSHSQDTIVFCSASGTAGAPQGAVRLLAGDGSPSVNGAGRPEVFVDGAWLPICSAGASNGAASVICKSMGFSGASGSSKCNGKDCGNVAPGIGELACSGSELGPLACPHEAGDDVFCAPSESLVVACAGDGETQGRPAKGSAPQPAA